MKLWEEIFQFLLALSVHSPSKYQLRNLVPCFGIIAVQSGGPARVSRGGAPATGGRGRGGRLKGRRSPRCRSTPRTRSLRGPADAARWVSSPCPESLPASRCTAASLWRWSGGILPLPPCRCSALSSTPSPWRNRTSLRREKHSVGISVCFEIQRITTKKDTMKY